MAKIYSSSWWGEGVCTNTIDWGSSYKALANCTPAFTNRYSLNFDAIDDSVDTGTITLGAEYTLSFWFKNAVTPVAYYTPLGANTLGGYVIILGATAGYWYYGNGSSARATVTDSAYTAAMSETSNWHNLTLVRNAPTNGTALFSDGEV